MEIEVYLVNEDYKVIGCLEDHSFFRHPLISIIISQLFLNFRFYPF